MKKQRSKHPKYDMFGGDLKKEDRINAELGRFKFKDLKRACILRGLEFESAIEWPHYKLSSWFRTNYDNGEDVKRLVEYDQYVESKLIERGYKKGDAMMSPSLRMGYTGNLEVVKGKISEPGVKKVETPKIDKPKRERDEVTGVLSGTKKNLTYSLVDKGMEDVEIIKTVIKQYPEAKEKSIKIWIKRRRNANSEKA